LARGSKPVRDLNMEVQPVLDELITTHTTDYIAKQARAGKPFFVYTALSQFHPPFKAHPDFDQKSSERGGGYSDMIAEIDFRAGQILDAIKQAGVEDNTIVIFSSDNASGGFTRSRLAVRMDPGVALLRTHPTKAPCACPR
jgi:arylsulfatase A-like enzyme